MSNYEAAYEKLFVHNLCRYSSKRKIIKRLVERILDDPHYNTETLSDVSGKLNPSWLSQRQIGQEFPCYFCYMRRLPPHSGM